MMMMVVEAVTMLMVVVVVVVMTRQRAMVMAMVTIGMVKAMMNVMMMVTTVRMAMVMAPGMATVMPMKGHDAALAAVVGAQDEDDVLDRNDDDQRPEEQRQAAVDIGLAGRDRVVAGEDFLDRVQRAGPDVAIDDAERGQREDREALAGRFFRPHVAAVHRTPW